MVDCLQMSSHRDAEYQWLRTGEEALEAMLDAIANATQSIRLEMYIFHAGTVADKFREALTQACRRGLQVKVLLDALGSAYLPESFWREFRDSGGEFRWFNPIGLLRIFIRDHRKLLVCDEAIGFVGGFNIATEYCGDGVNSGWCDLGLRLTGPLARELAAEFDHMFACADSRHKPFARLRKSARTKTVSISEVQLLLGGPGRNNPLKRAVANDLKNAREVLVVSPYFVPPRKIRRSLSGLARAGATVRLILPGKSDLPIVRLAAQSYYRRLLRSGVEIYEYQPQILHAKLFIIDNTVYGGSANLDARSLYINYEVMIRMTMPGMVGGAREIFAGLLSHCRRIELEPWRNSRTILDRIKARCAHFLIARLDSFFASRQMRGWRLSTNRIRQAKKHKLANHQT